IPANPVEAYLAQWKGYGDWLGTGRIANQDRKHLSFDEAKKIVKSMRIRSRSEWMKFCKSGAKTVTIPANPTQVYKKEWKGWGDWLGTGRIADHIKEFWSFEKSKKYVHSLRLKKRKDWKEFCESGNKPASIPAYPQGTYSKEWKGWGDWLGTYTTSTHERKHMIYVEAKKYVAKCGIKSRTEWSKFCRSGKKPASIPSNPSIVYKKEWKGWGDWLGTGTIAPRIAGWSIENVKELIKDLIKNKVIDEWSENERYHLLLSKGVLNLSGSNRFSPLLKNLIIGPKTEEQRKVLKDFANSGSQDIPDLSNEKELQTATANELADLVKEERDDPLENENTQTVQQIMAQTEYLESICEDVELMQFFVHRSVNKLWKSAFRDSRGETINEIRLKGKTGAKFHDTVTETFLSEYDAMEHIKIPKGYSSQFRPRLMQRYVAYKIKTNAYFGNFSGTGAGKTLSAILASRVIDSKMTLIVCPNDVVDQWSEDITEVFPDSKVITGKTAFYTIYDKEKHQYLVLNYDKFSQEDSANLILNLVREKIDFIVLDEIHFIKKREINEEESKRRRNLGGLLTAVRKRNDLVKILGMSATPVINHLMEGRSLLEYMTGKVYEDLVTRPTVPNAMALHQKLSTLSIREMPEYKSDVVEHFVEVSLERPQNISTKQFKRNPLLIEQILTDARIPEIIKRIKGQTIIYTEYVTEIIDKLSEAITKAGFSYAHYTGHIKELKRFRDKKVQILIASKPISVGVDGLQDVCNNLIINTLPWTNAQYKQLIGRLHRLGQRNNVDVHIIKASIAGYEYDQVKWMRIEFKRTLADCAVDGRFPKSLLQSKEQMQMELIKWLERIERNEISTFQRRNLNIILAPTQRLEYIRKNTEFTKLNQQINSEYSSTTHDRIMHDPQLLLDYHRKLDETKIGWDIHPVNVITKKINEQKLPAHLIMKKVIGDFGCGRGELMELLKENKVYSFDHHNIINEKIIPCDMKDVQPFVKDEELDIAVFSLSLMGKNWPDYIKEARRCLTKNGLLLIAETTKSLIGRLSELRNVIKEQGFEIYDDIERGNFTFIEASKL
ncbi:MAG: integrase repeat-containing protein, partial [Nitrososphaeraceae archaeon]